MSIPGNDAIVRASPAARVRRGRASPRNWIAMRNGQVGLIDFERTCVAWAIEHEDPDFAQENREIVERLRRSSEHL